MRRELPPSCDIHGQARAAATVPRSGRSPAGHSCKHQVRAVDLVGVIRQVVVDWLVADRTLAFRRLPGNKLRRVRVEDVLSLAEERDRR